jgi:hypothetical protein
MTAALLPPVRHLDRSGKIFKPSMQTFSSMIIDAFALPKRLLRRASSQ